MTPEAPPCPYAQNAGFELKKKPLEGNGLTGCPKCGMEEDRDINRREKPPPQVKSTERCACFIRSWGERLPMK
ncbi:MAG: hypothetical protein KIH08_12145 [Candidatus Freyarchaeota archaeon]|nr:hypothetical protein [Candidatus Jordarchaeia archaeon]MBS7269985.1 hypothetical protein [Candidatus Jordarchaeia archaeon]MBS7281238.1 hypothetical protein [Candidatus Jordarchaeia archaeon]